MRCGPTRNCGTSWCATSRPRPTPQTAIRGFSGKVGVCVATSGPGATNLVTGIMGAKADSVPLVAITGQVARTALGSEAFQECDICSITATCTKKSFMVMSADDLAPTIREAFAIAQEGRPGPVLLDIPRDVQLEMTEAEFPEVTPLRAPELSEEARNGLQAAARLINEGRASAHHQRPRSPGFRRFGPTARTGRDHRHPGHHHAAGG